MSRPYAGARVGVLMGGWSGEHDVSLSSGSAVADALSSRGYDVVRLVNTSPTGWATLRTPMETPV